MVLLTASLAVYLLDELDIATVMTLSKGIPACLCDALPISVFQFNFSVSVVSNYPNC